MATPEQDKALRTKALAILRESRLCVVDLARGEDYALVQARVLVRGFSADHRVGFRAGAWLCTCPAGRAHTLCSHVVAAELVCHGVTPFPARPRP